MSRNMNILSVLERDRIKYRSRILSCSNFFDSHQLLQKNIFRIMSGKYITEEKKITLTLRPQDPKSCKELAITSIPSHSMV